MGWHHRDKQWSDRRGDRGLNETPLPLSQALVLRYTRSMGVSAASLREGDLIAGKYRVERVIGTGAMGVVVAAMHEELAERRAIKLMMPGAAGDPAGVARFVREAQSAARLKSEHVAKVFDIGRLDDGSPFMVMEFLEGSDLKRILDRAGQLPIAQATSYMIDACEAVGEAHALGIVHRDLKPANLFIAKGLNGKPTLKVLDFGIAKAGKLEMTHMNDLLGSPMYMAPEQVKSTKDADARADIWSLGVILFRMLTNKPPFEGEGVPEIMMNVLVEPVPSLRAIRPDIPEALEALIMRCLVKDREQRVQSAQELAALLAPFASTTGAIAPPPAASQATQSGASTASFVAIGTQGYRPETTLSAQTSSVEVPARKRKAGPFIALAIALLLGCVGGAAFWLGSNRKSPPVAAVHDVGSPSSLSPPSEPPSVAPSTADTSAPSAVMAVPIPTQTGSVAPLPTAPGVAAPFGQGSARPKPAASAPRPPIVPSARPGKRDAFGENRE